MPPITERKNWSRRIGWFVLLYVASFTAIAAFAFVLKALMPY